MKLFVVKDMDRWGYSLNVVRAPDAESALRLVSKTARPERAEVEELPAGNAPAILWCYDESPDSRDTE